LTNHTRRDLEEAEDQYQMALRTHLSNVDSLIKLHDSRLYVLERTFQQEVKKMQEDFKSEKENMITRFKSEKRLLSTVIDAIEKEEEERENDVRCS
jgi:dynein regulatory complex subunit 2